MGELAVYGMWLPDEKGNLVPGTVRVQVPLKPIRMDELDFSTATEVTIGPSKVVAAAGFEAPRSDPESTGRYFLRAAGLGPIESVEHLSDGSVRFHLRKREQPSNPEGAV